MKKNEIKLTDDIRVIQLVGIQKILDGFEAMKLINNLMTEGPAGHNVQQKSLSGKTVAGVALESLEKNQSRAALAASLYEVFLFYVGDNIAKGDCDKMSELLLEFWANQTKKSQN